MQITQGCTVIHEHNDECRDVITLEKRTQVPQRFCLSAGRPFYGLDGRNLPKILSLLDPRNVDVAGCVSSSNSAKIHAFKIIPLRMSKKKVADRQGFAVKIKQECLRLKIHNTVLTLNRQFIVAVSVWLCMDKFNQRESFVKSSDFHKVCY